MSKSSIQWTEMTWNPVTGCDKISAGCRFCYAEAMSKRLQGIAKQVKYRNGFTVTVHSEELQRPYSWTKPRMIFVNSMSDIFHKDVPDSFIVSLFDVMRENPQHVFQLLTKRSDRLSAIELLIEWPSNVWMGVTVENQDNTHRIEHLRNCSAKIKWLSIEPLLSPIQNLDLKGIHWVVVGGESGPSARPMNQQWVRDIRDDCITHTVPFFFKQWGGKNKKKAGRLLDGRTWDQFPQ